MKGVVLALGLAALVLGACSGSQGPEATPPPGVPLVGFSWDDNAIGFRDHNGQRFAFECMPPAPARVFVFGTDVYTDDSSICWAGVHAGVITAEEGGYVVVEIQPGRDEYTGTARNGVESRDHGSYSGSFEVVR